MGRKEGTRRSKKEKRICLGEVFTSNEIINSKRVRSHSNLFSFFFFSSFLLCLCTSTSTVWIVWNTSRKLFCFDVFFFVFNVINTFYFFFCKLRVVLQNDRFVHLFFRKKGL